ncbi:hypothetical protein CSTERLE_00645 [Thermoclostridium stercorarium subsp. leptospartum DSM 9219]|uniref:O-antigen ligase-related domain-containing protein n=1 Tax=Thermoclostridium stercorarium subsp. leptospartum DSM 9219 TaxID=1346611 RepID=A0A1B1YHJ9_THEST|nr:O-antigen ligase family protein [Thermoclostridium stercorarium]ANX00202.1 hypothetical protein CSTERLE_00645 [Thermoclostridium stercorarium subsp. leptospartum DSM 9219]
MSRKEQTRRNITKKENILKILRIFLIAALTIIIFYPPYLQGLYFEKHVLPTQIIVFTVFIIFLIYKWLKNDNTPFFKTPLEYVCLGFVIVYFISIFAAVHTRSAITEWLKYCMYFAVFYMISDLADNLKTKLLFLWTIIISAVGVSIIGLDAAFGGNLVRILNRFFNILGVEGNLFFGLFVGNRIHSTLQYPNALAAYLMAVYFIAIGLLMYYEKLWQKILISSFSFILFTTFMLTQSRGAQLLFPVALIILFIATQKGNRVNTLVHAILLCLPAGITSLLISNYIFADVLNKKALLYLISGLLATVLISILVKYIGNLLQKVNWKVYVLLILLIAIAVTAGMYYAVNSSIPAELSLIDSPVDRGISVSKDVALEPNKEYTLEFEAEGKMKEEKPYSFSVRITNKSLSDILFGGGNQVVRNDYSATNGFEKLSLSFNTEEDTKLVNINFVVYYSGTSATVNKALIIDKESGKVVKNVILKHKYNLDSLVSRFQNILLQQSLLSRIIFYKDGFKIFKDFWFLGAGGGAWSYLYRKYQSFNYTSNQAHNYPLQVAIETGILGIIVLVGFIIVIAICYGKYHKKKENNNIIIYALIITAIAYLLLHSFIDFDFAESSILLLYWALIALFNRELIDNSGSMRLNLSVGDKKRKNNIKVGRYQKYLLFATIITSFAALYFSSSFSIASAFAKQSFESLKNNDIEAAINKMKKAIKWDKFNETYVIGYNPMPNRAELKAGLIDILFVKNDIYKQAENIGDSISKEEFNIFQKQFSEALIYLKNVENMAENNLYLCSSLASFYFKTGNIDKGIDYLNRAISYFPFEPSLWHSKVSVYYQLMKEYFNNGEYDKAEKYISEGLNVIDEVKNVNFKNMNPFVLNDETIKLLQTIKFIQDNFDNEEELYDVNNVLHYSIFSMDVNSDNIPDQWMISNQETLNISINNDNLSVQTPEEAYLYLYTRYPIKLVEGKTYIIEIKTQDNSTGGQIYFSFIGIMSKAKQLNKEGNKYIGEILIENKPDDNGNQFRIYFERSCVIESITIKEMK